METIQQLMELGFTKHESILYITLCREETLSGYEASKICGIPRSNVYLALASLVEKGAVYKVEGEASKYIAVKPKELILNLKRRYNEIFDYLEKSITIGNESTEPYITVNGKRNIIDKMRNIIVLSNSRIYVSMSHVELGYVERDLRDAIERGLKVVIITSPGYSMDGARMYSNTKEPGQIRLIADTSYVMTGEIRESGQSACLFSKNANLIKLIKDSLTNEIKLIELKQK